MLLARTSSDVRHPSELPADLTWIPAVVPGGVHESLIAAGELPHPYRDQHEGDARWVEDLTWWYRGELEIPSGPAVLVLPSVDTVVDVWVGDTHLGRHETAFRPFEADVTALSGDLVLRFAPPLEGITAPASSQLTADLIKAFLAGEEEGNITDGDEAAGGILSNDLALTRRRKPTYSWGWDFGPRLPSLGLLAPPELHALPAVRLVGHHVRAVHVDAEARSAQVAIDIEVEAPRSTGDLTAQVVLTAPDGVATAVELHLPRSTSTTRRAALVVGMTDVHLWWTHDLGEPALYDLAITVDGTTTHDRVGLRTITIDRSADPEEPGRLFRFVLNGFPVFARGANWVPMSMLRGSVTPEQVRRLVALAKHGSMNMIRVWGGGAYEQDAFFDACDELGVMVWQDFMFACIGYPSEELDLQAEVAREAEHQTRRLRNHPSLAVWCGNNEIHGLHHAVYQTLAPADWGWHFFHAVLPDAVARNAPGTAYWPGSPWADSELADGRECNGVTDGDRHAWEVWHGMDIGAGGPTEFANAGERVHPSRYLHDKGKFISEFGIHAAPELATLERWTGSELALGSPALLHRNKDMPKDKGWALMEVETGVPADLPQYVDFSMACQAEGLKLGIEHYRRRQPSCSGTLVWQLNDVWPGLSWSVVDHDLVGKAGFYYLQRVYAPVLASFREEDGRLELWVSNSGRTTQALDLTVDVATFDGAAVLSERVRVDAAPGSSACVWSGDVQGGPDRFAWVSEAAGAVPANRHFFARLKDLPLGKAEHEVVRTATGPTSAQVRVTSRGYSYLTRVTSPVAGPVFSTNYLDLRDGETVTVEVTGLPVGFDLEQLQVGQLKR